MNNYSHDNEETFYKNKYLLYKRKYINLQKKLGGAPKDFLIQGESDEDLVNSPNTFLEQLPNKYLEELQNIYPIAKHDYGKLNDSYDGHTITYGEMDYDGMDQILDHLHKNKVNFNNFIDIGSGRGKLPLHLASLPNIMNSVGIELVKERHNEAEELKNKLIKFKSIIDKVVLINDDFNRIELSEYIDGATLVWISNLCFSQELTDEIFNKLLKILPSDSIIVCSKKHTLETYKISEIGTLQVPMSWNKNSTIYLYKIM